MPINLLRDLLTKSPLVALMDIEGKLPKGAPKLSLIMLNIADLFPSFGPPAPKPRSVEEVLPPIPELLGAEPKLPVPFEELRKVAEPAEAKGLIFE